MSAFDIKAMGRGYIFATEQHPSFKETVAVRLVETAVEIINNTQQTDALLSNVTHAYEMTFGMDRVDDQVMGLVEMMRKDMSTKGWDPRTKIKLVERKLSNTYHRLVVVMDLEATVKSFNEGVRKQSRKRATPIADVVSDNPGAELINELDRLLCQQSQPRTPLLSDRGGRFVRDDQTGNRWR